MSHRTSTRSERWARIVHLGSLVILGLVLAAIVLGAIAGDGGGQGEGADPLYLVLVIVVVAGFSTLGRLIVTRAGNVLGWVFLVMGAALALGLPAEGYLDVAFREPYVASLPGTEVAGLLANAFPAVMAYSIPMLFLLFPTGSPPTPRWRWVIWTWLTGTILSGIWLLFRSRERLRGARQVQDREPARPRVPAAARTAAARRRGGDRPRVGGGGRGVPHRPVPASARRGAATDHVVAPGRDRRFAADAHDVRPRPVRDRRGLRRPLDRALDGARAGDPRGDSARDLPVPPVRRGRRRLEDDRVRGAGTRDRPRLRRDRDRTGSADRRRVRRGAPARRGDPGRHRRAAGLVAVQPAREPDRLRRTVHAVPGDGRVRRPDRADPVGRRAPPGHGGGGGARRGRARRPRPDVPSGPRGRRPGPVRDVAVGGRRRRARPDAADRARRRDDRGSRRSRSRPAIPSGPTERTLLEDLAAHAGHRSRERTPLRGPRTAGGGALGADRASSGVRGSASSRSETRSGAGSSRSSGTVSAPRSRRSGTRSATTRHASSRSPTACAIPWSG